MATYVPNATDFTEPLESQTVESAALEFRTLKARVNALDAAVAADDLTDLRVPETSIAVLPAIASRAGKVLGFDAGGDPAMVDVAGTTDPSLRSDLAASSGASLVGYLPAGAGEVPTTIQAKLRESVSVRDFGAVGDGVTDDTAAFQTAVNYGSAGSRFELTIPPGVYKLTSAITITNRSIVINGAGARSSILQFYGCNGLVHQGDYLLDVRDIGLETDSLGLYTGITYGVSAPVLTLDTIRASHVNLFGIIYGSNYWGSGITVQDASNTWFDRVTVIGQSAVSPRIGGRGIRLLSTVAKASTGHHFNRCSFNFLEYGVEVIASAYPSIEGVRFDFCGFVSVRFGIAFDAATAGYTPPLLSICNSHIDLAAASTAPIAIKCTNIAQVIISGNDFYSYANDGVVLYLVNTTQVSVVANTFIGGFNTNMAGILMADGATYTDISNNLFSGPFTNAIYALANAGTLNREIDNRFPGVITEVLDGTESIMRSGKTKVRVKRTSVQTLTTGIDTAISWQAVDENVSSSWVVGFPTRLLIPAGVKTVRFQITVRFAVNGIGCRQVFLKKNGAFFLGTPISTAASASATQPTDITINSEVLDVEAGNYFEVAVLQTSGGNLNIDQSVTYATMTVVRMG